MEVISIKSKLQPVTKTTYKSEYNWKGDIIKTNETKYYLMEYIRKMYFLGIPVCTLKFFVEFPNNGFILHQDIEHNVNAILKSRETGLKPHLCPDFVKINLHPQEIVEREEFPYNKCSRFESEEAVQLVIDLMNEYPDIFIM